MKHAGIHCGGLTWELSSSILRMCVPGLKGWYSAMMKGSEEFSRTLWTAPHSWVNTNKNRSKQTNTGCNTRNITHSWVFDDLVTKLPSSETRHLECSSPMTKWKWNGTAEHPGGSMWSPWRYSNVSQITVEMFQCLTSQDYGALQITALDRRHATVIGVVCFSRLSVIPKCYVVQLR